MNPRTMNRQIRLHDMVFVWKLPLVLHTGDKKWDMLNP